MTTARCIPSIDLHSTRKKSNKRLLPIPNTSVVQFIPFYHHQQRANFLGSRPDTAEAPCLVPFLLFLCLTQADFIILAIIFAHAYYLCMQHPSARNDTENSA